MPSQVCDSENICFNYARAAFAFEVEQYRCVAMRCAASAVDMHDLGIKELSFRNVRHCFYDSNAIFDAFVLCRTSLFKSPYHYIISSVFRYFGAIYEESRCATIAEFVADKEYLHYDLASLKSRCLYIEKRQKVVLIALLAVIHQSIVESE